METLKMPSERLVRLAVQLEPTGDTDTAIEQLLENELIRRLNRYQASDRELCRKYGMSFAEFQSRRTVATLDYSFEVESDFWDWELSIDGIETTRRMLAELKGTRNAGC